MVPLGPSFTINESMCADKATYSDASFGSEPFSTPITFSDTATVDVVVIVARSRTLRSKCGIASPFSSLSSTDFSVTPVPSSKRAKRAGFIAA